MPGMMPGDYNLFLVRDTGRGISAGMEEKIFEPSSAQRKREKAPASACM